MQLRDGDVTLRPLEEDDLVLLARWRNESSEWFFSSHPLAISEQKAWYARYLASGNERMYIIEHLEEVRPGQRINHRVGALALVGIDSLHRRAEVGRVVMDSSRTNKGYATAGLNLLCTLAFEGLNLRRLYVEVLAKNDLAIWLYEKVGFVKEGTMREHVWKDGVYQDVLVMGKLRDEPRNGAVVTATGTAKLVECKKGFAGETCSYKLSQPFLYWRDGVGAETNNLMVFVGYGLLAASETVVTDGAGTEILRCTISWCGGLNSRGALLLLGYEVEE